MAALPQPHTIDPIVCEKRRTMAAFASSWPTVIPSVRSGEGGRSSSNTIHFGINRGFPDQYAITNCSEKNHTLINYSYCVDNPSNYYGYSESCWGLTASDSYPPINYTAHAPDNDQGVITPTAALSSFPYTPTESMRALKFFYYTLGDKIWKDYGFVDAFSLDKPWFADSFLAIDQGPIIVMIENYRSGLLWNLFTSCPEVKAGMTKLGFHAPYL
jgi:hypothetical protein